ncbi:MAG: pyrimidine 5'-nucleotidase [Candidatus Accumulibacter sp.]|jgi:putative hydrolase of the HAD superfamily|nr:pyrimidine 5'-nucleotidase [Accumulibacter sp.]
MKTVARTWLFDLDNTLHDAGAHIFPRISRAMRDYIRRHLGLDETQATALRQSYWKRYGATLPGLMRHHGIDPEDFLRRTHQFHDLPRLVVVERGLKAMLDRLPGRKIVFSNAPLHYARAILAIAGIDHCFDAVYSIERLRYRPKPSTHGFLRLMRAERLAPESCVMVDDSLPNLRKAKRLGMTTVWVDPGTRRPPCADIRVASVLDLPSRLRQIRP